MATIRENLFTIHREGHVSATEVNEFVENARFLQKNDVDGLSEAMKKVDGGTNYGNYKGVAQELEIVRDIGPEKVEKLSVNLGTSGVDGEIDIELKNGDFIESKNKDWSEAGGYQFNDVETKIEGLKEHKEIDGQTLRYVVRNKPDEDAPIRGMVEEFEKELQKEGIDVEITFAEPSEI